MKTPIFIFKKVHSFNLILSIYISSNEFLIEENKSSLCEDILKSIENKVKSEIIQNKSNMSFNQDLIIPSPKLNDTGSNWFDKS
jgi:hypothetical protein